jgi:hypothetical protein
MVTNINFLMEFGCCGGNPNGITIEGTMALVFREFQHEFGQYRIDHSPTSVCWISRG